MKKFKGTSAVFSFSRQMQVIINVGVGQPSRDILLLPINQIIK
jgi:hypothetical protein